MISERFIPFCCLIQTKYLGTVLSELFGSCISNVIRGSMRRCKGLGQVVSCKVVSREKNQFSTSLGLSCF